LLTYQEQQWHAEVRGMIFGCITELLDYA